MPKRNSEPRGNRGLIADDAARPEIGELRDWRLSTGGDPRLSSRGCAARTGSRGCLCPEMAGAISVSAGLVTVDVRAFAGDLGIHADSSAGALDGHWAGCQSPSGSVVCPTSIRWPSGSRM